MPLQLDLQKCQQKTCKLVLMYCIFLVIRVLNRKWRVANYLGFLFRLPPFPRSGGGAIHDCDNREKHRPKVLVYILLSKN